MHHISRSCLLVLTLVPCVVAEHSGLQRGGQLTGTTHDLSVDSNFVDSMQALLRELRQVSNRDESLAKKRGGSQKQTAAVDTWGGYWNMRISAGAAKMKYDFKKGCVRSYRDHATPPPPDPMRGFLNSADSIMPEYRHISEAQARQVAFSFLVTLAGQKVASELELSAAKHVADGYSFDYETPSSATAYFFDGRRARVVVCPVTGRVVSYYGDLYPWTKPDYNPKIDHQRGNTILQSFIKDSNLTVTGILGGELSQEDIKGARRWVWEFFVGEPNQRMNRTVWIDAETGEILRTL